MKKIILVLLLFTGNYFISVSQTGTTKNDLRGWKLIEGFLIEPISFDTTINYFQIMNPIERVSVSNSYLGNLGSAWKSNVYFTETNLKRTDFIFDRNYVPYVFSKENQVFYHSRTPYFDINWTTATKKRNENQLNALYTQNINEKWNVGFRYRLNASDGEFPRSLISEHSLNLFASYIGEKYSVHTAYLRNKFKSEESGGINDTLSQDPEFAQALLESASSVYYDRSFFISQEYKFGFTKKIVINDSTTESNFHEAGRLNHVFSYNDNYRIYYSEGLDTSFYKNIRLDSTLTRDSIHMVKIENSLHWTFKEIKRPNFNGRFTVGAAMENLKWINTDAYPKIDSISANGDTTFVSADTLLVDKKYNNFKLMASLDARTRMFVFNANAYYYIPLSDNKAANFEGNVLISKSIMVGKQKSDFYFKLKLTKNSPYIFEEEYQSNHFEWNTSFNDVVKSEGRVGLQIPALRIKGEFAYGIVDNYIYFDTTGLPEQFDESFNVMSFRLHKDFKLGHFYLKNKVVYQIPPANASMVIDMPEWAIYHSFYYDLDHFLDKYSIEAQVGYDLNYASSYRALGYMPATGQFFQSDRKTGHYPVINVFVNMRIKNVLLFFKFEHLNNQFLINRYYFILDKYPINTTAFKFGVSWRFMN